MSFSSSISENRSWNHLYFRYSVFCEYNIDCNACILDVVAEVACYIARQTANNRRIIHSVFLRFVVQWRRCGRWILRRCRCSKRNANNQFHRLKAKQNQCLKLFLYFKGYQSCGHGKLFTDCILKFSNNRIIHKLYNKILKYFVAWFQW